MVDTTQHRREIKLRLVVLGFDEPSDAMSRLLGASPTHTWRAGDPVMEGAANIHHQNGWQIVAPVDPAATTGDEAVAAIVALLPDLTAFRRLPPKVEVQLSCTLFGYLERPYLELSPQSVASLAAMGASLDVDIYDLTAAYDEDA